jgi:hypothetical protein
MPLVATRNGLLTTTTGLQYKFEVGVKNMGLHYQYRSQGGGFAQQQHFQQDVIYDVLYRSDGTVFVLTSMGLHSGQRVVGGYQHYQFDCVASLAQSTILKAKFCVVGDRIYVLMVLTSKKIQLSVINNRTHVYLFEETLTKQAYDLSPSRFDICADKSNRIFLLTPQASSCFVVVERGQPPQRDRSRSQALESAGHHITKYSVISINQFSPRMTINQNSGIRLSINARSIPVLTIGGVSIQGLRARDGSYAFADWQADSTSNECSLCGVGSRQIIPGLIFSNKHHCRLCGTIMCAEHTVIRHVYDPLNRWGGRTKGVSKTKICTTCDRSTETRRNAGINTSSRVVQGLWLADSQSNICFSCRISIKSTWFSSNKHHCRLCGQIICVNCVRKKWVDNPLTPTGSSDRGTITKVCVNCC